MGTLTDVKLRMAKKSKPAVPSSGLNYGENYS